MIRFCCLLGFVALIAAGCGGEKLPSRDEIPKIREKLYSLEQGILKRDRAGLDSLLSVDILDFKESSDSLLRFVYGADSLFPFRKLGDYTIFFNKKMAVIDCFIMDSTSREDRPLRLIYKLQHNIWLLTEFRAGHPDSTSLM